MTAQKLAYLNLIWALLLVACGEPENPFSLDASATPDSSSIPRDAQLQDGSGKVEDASLVRPPDASMSADASRREDAATIADAALDDASPDNDASSGIDASTAGDASTTDSGMINTRSCGGTTARKCRRNEYCKYALSDNCGQNDATGECTARPEACRDVFDPVCGCDGKNYSNACYAASAGISVASEGNCAQ